ncbi:DUF429 domain-containing protein [Pseudonocardia sp. MCCB 268]|nr:DUF429 domain-containing protein [Pseudonocardia cytotoxica]
MRVGGVDGVPTGWVVCVLSGTGRSRRADWSVVPDAAAVLAVTEGDAVGVDIPLCRSRPARPARRRGPRGRPARDGPLSCFPRRPHRSSTPVYEDVCAAAVRVTGKKISMQAWNIVPKIREFRRVELPDPVVEAHPSRRSARWAPGRCSPEVDGARRRAAGSPRSCPAGPGHSAR